VAEFANGSTNGQHRDVVFPRIFYLAESARQVANRDSLNRLNSWEGPGLVANLFARLI